MDSDSLLGLHWSALRREAKAYDDQHASDAFEHARVWYRHSAWEVRHCAISVLGHLAAAGDGRALAFLAEECGEDPAWQVNEALAMAFDDVCAARGYEPALPLIREWLAAPQANRRRAVSEGLRPWTARKRTYFAQNPQVAIDLLGTLRDDDSRYVQQSVGNALRDIWRQRPDLVLTALRQWQAEQPDSQARKTITRFTLKKAVKDDPALRELFA